MSQFRKTGVYYVSQWDGDDLNAGTDPTAPKATIGSLPNSSSASNKAILGAGVYREAWTGARCLEGDGKVIVDLMGATSGITTLYAKGIHFRNYGGNLGGSIVCTLEECTFENVSGVNLCTLITRSVFLDIFRITGNSNFRDLFHSIVLKGNDLSGSGGYIVYRRFVGNYVDKNATIYYTQDPLSMANNLFNGKYRNGGIGSTLYEAKLLWDGSPRPDADPLIPDIIDVIPTFYSQGNFAGDPKFIDILSGTVEPDSDLLRFYDPSLATGNFSNTWQRGYIGGVKVGKKIDLDESGFTITKTNIDDSNPNSWKILGGASYAKVRITGKISDSLISAQTLDIRIPFFFDGSETGGTTENNNVPDAWNARTTPDTKGLIPNRLTFEVRSSQLENPGRDVSSDWDNDNENSPSIAGQYYLMEWGQSLMHHIDSGVAYGNADANAINAPTIQPFNYRSLDIIITITNTREI